MTTPFANLPLHRRVAIFGALMVLILLAVAHVSIYGTHQLSAHEADTLDHEVNAALLLLNIDRDLYQAQTSLEHACQADAGLAAAELLLLYHDNVAQVGDRFNRYLEIAQNVPGEQAVQAQFLEARESWLALGQEVIRGLQQNAGISDSAAQELKPVRERFIFVRERINELVDAFYHPMLQESLAYELRLTRQIHWTVIGSTAVAGILATLLIAVSVRAIYVQEQRVEARNAEREQEAQRQAFEHRLHRAMEMARTEDDALRLTERVVAEALPDAGVEVLLADSSRAHLRVAAKVNLDTAPTPCTLPTPFECPAVRCGHRVNFQSSRAFDACPHLRRRFPDGASASCVPLSIMGQTMGVLSWFGRENEPAAADTLATLNRIAGALSDRLGVVRAFATSEAQASTDPLTGLLNRRSFEARLARLYPTGEPFALAFGDIDRFKQLNDTHGHETGDRALRLLSRVLKAQLREDDVAARWGGEEFLLLLPGLNAEQAEPILQRIRQALVDATPAGATPPFTISFGVGDRDDANNFEDLLGQVDAGLMRAKAEGRDRVIRITPTDTLAA